MLSARSPVASAPVLSISGGDSLIVGKQIKLTATYVSGSSKKRVTPVWTSSAPRIAEITAAGALKGKTAGTVTITALYSGCKATKRISVQKKLTGLTLSGNATVGANERITLSATAQYNDNSRVNIAPQWSSSSTKIATVSASGVISGITAGTCVIRARYSYNGTVKTAQKKITVTKKLAKLTISGAASLTLGRSAAMTCCAVYSDGSQQKVVPSWSLIQYSSWETKPLATISSTGVLTYQNAGINSNTVISVKAAYLGMSASKSVTLTNVVSSGPGNSGGYFISGPSSVKYLGTASYYLYHNNQKITSSSVSWSRSGQCTMSDKGSYGYLKATNKPTGSSMKVTVIVKYNGFHGTKTVTITR